MMGPCCLISKEEVAVAIKGSKNGEAAGLTGVVSEMMKPSGGSKRHSLQAVERSQRTQAAVQIVSNLGGPIYRFFGMPAMRTCWMAGAAAHKSG